MHSIGFSGTFSCVNANISFSRQQALAAGTLVYFTGAPCPLGHAKGRITKNGACVVCVKAYKKAYDAVHGKDASRRYRAANLDKVRAYHAARYEAQKDKFAARGKARREAHPEFNRAALQRYKARKKLAQLRRLDEFDFFVMDEAAILAVDRSRISGINWHVDHMVPLRAKTACGLHVGANMQVIPARMNQTKSNRMLYSTPGAWITAL